jgi:hypothetical protein
MIVAFVEVETAHARQFRMAATGITNPHEARQTGDAYWCVADRPTTDETFAVAPIYRTSKVPADAECEHCGIGIRELQEMLTK